MMVNGPDPSRWRCPACEALNLLQTEQCFHCGSARDSRAFGASAAPRFRGARGALRRNAPAIAVWTAAACVGVLVVSIGFRGTSHGMLTAEGESGASTSYTPVLATPVAPPPAPPMAQGAGSAPPVGGPLSAPMAAAPAPRALPPAAPMVQSMSRGVLLPPAPSLMAARGTAPTAPSITAAVSGPAIPAAPSVVAAPAPSSPAAPGIVAAATPEPPKSASMVNSEGWLVRRIEAVEPEIFIRNDDGLQGTFTLTDGYHLRRWDIKPNGLRFHLTPGVYDYRVLSSHYRRTGHPDQMGKLTLKKYRSYEARFFVQVLDGTVVKHLGDDAEERSR